MGRWDGGTAGMVGQLEWWDDGMRGWWNSGIAD